MGEVKVSGHEERGKGGEVEPPKFRVFYEGAGDSPYLCDFEESETKYFNEQPDAESYAQKLVSDLLRVAAKESEEVDKVLIRDARDGRLIKGWKTEDGKIVEMGEEAPELPPGGRGHVHLDDATSSKVYGLSAFGRICADENLEVDCTEFEMHEGELDVKKGKKLSPDEEVLINKEIASEVGV